MWYVFFSKASAGQEKTTDETLRYLAERLPDPDETGSSGVEVCRYMLKMQNRLERARENVLDVISIFE
ncbi:MAG: hypothetical protein KDA77_20265, partial [Planctomycetaceae bacterium]|nr:hypothetical protein [Planctomycetaceae bacterium]